MTSVTPTGTATGAFQSLFDSISEPIGLFQRWFDEAAQKGLPLPEAMTLATTGADGRPAARTVLYKGMRRDAFSFFTNYESRKGRELTQDKYAALLFHWATLERQVRVEGPVERTTEEESDDYWITRPRASQLGAWASHQSAEISGYAELEARYHGFDERFPAHVPRPPYWGGFRVIPRSVEFWHGMPGRLHERVLFRRAADGSWEKAQLAP